MSRRQTPKARSLIHALRPSARSRVRGSAGLCADAGGAPPGSPAGAGRRRRRRWTCARTLCRRSALLVRRGRRQAHGGLHRDGERQVAVLQPAGAGGPGGGPGRHRAVPLPHQGAGAGAGRPGRAAPGVAPARRSAVVRCAAPPAPDVTRELTGATPLDYAVRKRHRRGRAHTAGPAARAAGAVRRGVRRARAGRGGLRRRHCHGARPRARSLTAALCGGNRSTVCEGDGLPSALRCSHVRRPTRHAMRPAADARPAGGAGGRARARAAADHQPGHAAPQLPARAPPVRGLPARPAPRHRGRGPLLQARARPRPAAGHLAPRGRERAVHVEPPRRR